MQSPHVAAPDRSGISPHIRRQRLHQLLADIRIDRAPLHRWRSANQIVQKSKERLSRWRPDDNQPIDVRLSDRDSLCPQELLRKLMRRHGQQKFDAGDKRPKKPNLPAVLSLFHGPSLRLPNHAPAR